MRSLAVALGAGLVALALTAQVWAGAAVAGEASATDGTPTPSSTSAAVSVIIPDTASPTPSPSSSHSGGGSHGGGDTTPTPTPTPAVAPSPAPAPGQPADGLKLDHERIATGEWMVAIGTGFQPGEQVQLVLYSDPVVVHSFTADASGRFEARFKIPKTFRLGLHTAEATGWESKHVANKRFTVVSAPAPAGTVPFLWWLIVVIGVLVIGVIVVAVYFRRTIAGWFGGVHVQPSGTPT
jgi:hypothetical protein